MVAAKGALGVIFLFLGRELNFLFAGGFAALLAIRVLPLLPATWPSWGYIAFIIALAGIAIAIAITNQRAGYVLSGFLAGGYFLSDYFVPGFIAIPIFPFLVGGVAGGIVMGFLTEWAMMIVSSAIGAFFVMDLFALTPIVKTMITGGLFLVGALTQVIIRRMQQK